MGGGTIYPLVFSILLCTAVLAFSFWQHTWCYTPDDPLPAAMNPNATTTTVSPTIATTSSPDSTHIATEEPAVVVVVVGGPYPDYLLDHSPNWSDGTTNPTINGTAAGLHLICCFIFVLFHPFRLVVLRRCLFLFSVGQVLYALSLVVTRFPQPNPNFHPDTWYYTGFPVQYSISVLMVHFYTRSRIFALRWIFTLFSVVTFWLLLPTRVAYTIDIIVGSLCLIWPFILYHWYVRTPTSIEALPVLWKWFEQDTLEIMKEYYIVDPECVFASPTTTAADPECVFASPTTTAADGDGDGGSNIAGDDEEAAAVHTVTAAKKKEINRKTKDEKRNVTATATMTTTDERAFTEDEEEQAAFPPPLPLQQEDHKIIAMTTTTTPPTASSSSHDVTPSSIREDGNEEDDDDGDVHNRDDDPRRNPNASSSIFIDHNHHHHHHQQSHSSRSGSLFGMEDGGGGQQQAAAMMTPSRQSVNSTTQLAINQHHHQHQSHYEDRRMLLFFDSFAAAPATPPLGVFPRLLGTTSTVAVPVSFSSSSPAAAVTTSHSAPTNNSVGISARTSTTATAARGKQTTATAEHQRKVDTTTSTTTSNRYSPVSLSAASTTTSPPPIATGTPTAVTATNNNTNGTTPPEEDDDGGGGGVRQQQQQPNDKKEPGEDEDERASSSSSSGRWDCTLVWKGVWKLLTVPWEPSSSLAVITNTSVTTTGGGGVIGGGRTTTTTTSCRPEGVFATSSSIPPPSTSVSVTAAAAAAGSTSTYAAAENGAGYSAAHEQSPHHEGENNDDDEDSDGEGVPLAAALLPAPTTALAELETPWCGLRLVEVSDDDNGNHLHHHHHLSPIPKDRKKPSKGLVVSGGGGGNHPHPETTTVASGGTGGIVCGTTGAPRASDTGDTDGNNLSKLHNQQHPQQIPAQPPSPPPAAATLALTMSEAEQTKTYVQLDPFSSTADFPTETQERLAMFSASQAIVNHIRKWVPQRWAQVMIVLIMLAFSGAIVVAGGGSNVFASDITNELRPLNRSLPPDIGFQWLPTVPEHTPDYMLYSFAGLLGLYALYLPQRWTIFRRIGFQWGVLFLLRFVCVLVTSPPDPSPICKYREHPPGTTCGDLIYSGHTCGFLLAAFTVHEYVPLVPIVVLSYLYTITALVMVVASKLHYTRDVLVAVLVACSVHHLLEVGVFRRPDVLLRKRWLLLFEFDGYCDVVAKNKLIAQGLMGEEEEPERR